MLTKPIKITIAIILGLILLVFLVVKCGQEEVQEKTYTKEDYDKLAANYQAKTRELEMEQAKSISISKELMRCAQLQDSIADVKHNNIKERSKDREKNIASKPLTDSELQREISELYNAAH